MTDVLTSPVGSSASTGVESAREPDPSDRARGDRSDLLTVGTGADGTGGLTPLEHYLREQQTMTAVERFARHHDDGDAVACHVPAQARYYRDLIPLDRPRTGQQYAFEVDLDSCSGCKACVTACHSLNGLDPSESFRSVGALVGTVATGTRSGAVGLTGKTSSGTAHVAVPWQQNVTTACHHCVDPACLNGCPVDAYEKDPFTGIVRHLDDQCIGCSYCTLMCPYDVPEYNAALGIVRKCDMCSDRLAEGEAPACVQACPTSAISVTIVDVAEAIMAAAASSESGAPAKLVPAAPPSRLTVPTTRYLSSRSLPVDALPADHFSLTRAHAHPPLTVMLVLTQLAVGAFACGWLVDGLASPALASSIRPYGATLALVVGLLALGASTLHLGRPAYAWRAVIGLRHSWLSREIVAFALFAGLATMYACLVALAAPAGPTRAVGGMVTVAGLAGVACSVMIYAVTARRWWRASHTGPKFVLTSVITGASAVMVAALVATAVDGATVRSVAGSIVFTELVRPLSLVVLVASAVKLAGEVAMFRHLHDGSYTDLRRTAMLLRGDLAGVTVWRYAAGVFGGLFAPVVLLAVVASHPSSVAPSLALAMAGLFAVTAGEICERWQFFTAITSPRMPGVPS